MKILGTGAAQTSTYGEWEPVAYLMAWDKLGPSHDDARSHRRSAPLAAEVAAAFAELRDWFTGA